ncbi:hypothetical protein GCM10008171_12580 [Methylopila jiangsuensis]|uniref:Uncharacterized protein n=1 Tax=Methylopila jiangsuensis TaxID=586230 RepID=A0A9W6JH93_9HYPH|nr:hypothetical protein GCM10008171_12580 [Methylopila jiangsuensis]
MGAATLSSAICSSTAAANAMAAGRQRGRNADVAAIRTADTAAQNKGQWVTKAW